MALERLQGLTTVGVPDLDCTVVRRRREPGRVVREGDRADPIVSERHSYIDTRRHTVPRFIKISQQ